jgi:hypothetical protein
MKRILIVLPLLLLGTIAIAQTNYDASLIPKELLPYASAVVRNEKTSYEVKSPDNTIYHVKRAITVLNKNGDDKIDLDIFYDRTNGIRYIKGNIYNEYGKMVQKISESDFEDEAVSDGFSLYQDVRVKHFKKASAEYPYTIEYEYEVRNKQSLYFNDWTPNDDTNLAVEKSSYTFICKPEFKIRYKEINIPQNVETGTNMAGLRTYTWYIQNLKAVRKEVFSPSPRSVLSRVIIAPEKFEYFGTDGSFTNWEQLGKWEYDKLLTGRQDIPAETAQYIKEITTGITDPKLKAKKIYEYMQDKTHYVSIQIGVGGYQPFPASDVDKLNYGDCKALVNYTRSLLKTAGIESYYCVVEAGREHKTGLMSDFASMNQGNHVILCLPFKNDTTWLECTSQQIPFGFLSDFTDDRTVLACTPEGGKLMHTPKYTAEENLEKRKASFVLTETGELMGNMETVFKGTDYDDRYRLIEEAPVERIKDIKKYYPINILEIEKLDFKQDKSIKPVTTEDIKLSAREYGAVNNGKVYFSLNSVDRTHPLRQLQNRVNPVYINRGYTEDDEITYTLPKGYRLESEPLKKSIEKPFGSFTAVMTLHGDQLVYTRKFQLKDGAYSKDTYQDMVDFYQSVADADDYNVTLVKN